MKIKTHLLSSILALLFFVSCEPSTKTISEKEVTETGDTIPFVITEGNNINFKTLLNGVDTLDLYFDSGGTELVLKHSTVKEKTSLLKDKNENYKAVNYEPLEELNSISIGKMKWDSLTIYPTSLLPKEADGHFGWNLFEDKVVELDYEKSLMIVHSSFNQDTKGYAKLDIEYINTLFCVKGNMQVNEQSFSNRYLFDTGFQRAVVLDRDLTAEDKFPQDLPVIKESRLRNSEGTEFINKVVAINKICFEEICVDKVPVQLLSTPNPARFKTHILGNELLKRFNTILDFQNDVVYMKPNNLMDMEYKDAS